MSDFLSALAAILVSWAALGALFIGLGALTCRALRMRLDRPARFLDAFWIGWCAALIILQVLHLFLEVDAYALALLTVLAVLGLALSRAEVKQAALDCWRRHRALLCLAGLAAIWLAGAAMGPPTLHDTGLYHLTTVRWLRSFPIVPGLGNLHGRLAFNNSYFLYVAALDIGDWTGQSFHLANGLLILAALATMLPSLARLTARGAERSAFDIFCAVMIVPLVLLGRGPAVCNPSSGLAVYVLAIVPARWLMAMLGAKKDESEERRFLFLAIVLVSAVGITAKLNLAAFCVAASLVAWGVWMRGERDVEPRLRKRTLVNGTALAVVLATAALIPWMIRGVILSGYPAYPSAFGAFAVDWRMPRADVVAMRQVITGWARSPGPEWARSLEGWKWLGPWLRRTLSDPDVTVPLCLALIGAAGMIAARLLRRGGSARPRGARLFFAPCFASLVFWFIMAPARDFAGSVLWILAAGSLGFAADSLLPRPIWPGASRLRRVVHGLIVLVFLWFLIGGKGACVRTFKQERRLGHAIGRLYFNSDLVMGHPPYGGLQSAPSVRLRLFETRSGLVVYVPAAGDQCWDAPLPCAPEGRTGLAYRRPDSLRHGFRIEAREER